MTKVKLIRGTEQPEGLVCTAARNDYRSEGVIDYSEEELLDGYNINNTVNTADWDDVPSAETTLDVKKYSLLKQLMSDEHWGPFEHPYATIALEGVTRVSMAQITRHRQFTFDIMSLRYVELNDIDDIEERFQIPEVVKDTDEVATRKGVKELDDDVEEAYIEAYEDCIDHYQNLLDKGVPQEEARKVLPMGTKVNIVMSGNARAWMHLLNIRGKADVQGEARRLAESIMEECKEWMPYTFHEYDERVDTMHLTP